MLSAVAGVLDSLGLDQRHYAVCAAHADTNCPHVHVAVSRIDPETGRAVNLDKNATRRLSRWVEQYERDHGGVVVPGRVERREARAARRSLERRCRKTDMPRNQARATAARLHPRPPARRARKRSPSPAGTPARAAGAVDAAGRTAAWRGYSVTGPPKSSGPNSGDANGEPTRPREPRRAPPAAPPLSPPRSASIRKLRAAGARQHMELRRRHQTERASLARRFGRAAVRALRRGATAIRKLFRKRRPDADVEAERRQHEAERHQLEADLADARRRRARQTRDRLSEAATRTGIAHRHANDDLRYHERRRRASRDERTQRRADAAYEACIATRHARHRSEFRLLVYENAARTVGLDLSRRSSKAPYSPSLEQLVARGGPASGARAPGA